MKHFILLIVVAGLLCGCGDTFGHTTREQIRADRDVAVAQQHSASSQAWANSLRDGVSSAFRYTMWAFVALCVFGAVAHFFWSAGGVAEASIRAHENIRIAEIHAGVRHAQIAADDRARLMDFLERTDAGKLQAIAASQFQRMVTGPGVTVVEQGRDQLTGHQVGALVVNGRAQAYRLTG